MLLAELCGLLTGWPSFDGHPLRRPSQIIHRLEIHGRRSSLERIAS